MAGDDLFSGMYTLSDAASWCSANSTCQGFTFASNFTDCNGQACNVYFKSALAFAASAGWQTYEKPQAPINNATTTFFEYTNATLGAIGTLHTGLMTGLAPNTLYYYVVGNATGGWSPLKWFTNEPVRPGGPIYAILADFGLGNDESLVALYADAERNAFDYVLHAGDFAYDFDTDGGTVGNAFMRDMDGYASRYPVMPCPGNHESHWNFSQYTTRFAGVAANAGKNSGSGSAVYYSFDVGLVHFVAFSTEVYWAMEGAVAPQIAWLKADLAQANANRANVPWIVAFGHKGWYMDTTYCTQTGGCVANGTWFDVLLQEAGVDLYFVGHMHEYRRFVPNYGTLNLTDSASMSPDMHTYSNPAYMTTIVTGAPGNALPPAGAPLPPTRPSPRLRVQGTTGTGTSKS